MSTFHYFCASRFGSICDQNCNIYKIFSCTASSRTNPLKNLLNLLACGGATSRKTEGNNIKNSLEDMSATFFYTKCKQNWGNITF